MKKKFILKNITHIIMLSYILLFSRMLQECFQIDHFNYAAITSLYLLAVLIFLFYKYVLKTRLFKVIFTLMLIMLSVILILKQIINIYWISYITIVHNINEIIKLFNNNLPINFYLFLPLFAVLIPSIIITIFLLKDKLPVITIIFTMPLMYMFWYYGFEIKTYIAIYLMLIIFELSINMYSYNLYLSKKRNYINMVPKNNIILYSALVVTGTILFTGACGEIFGVKSLSEIRRERISEVFQKVNSIQNAYGIKASGYGSNSEKLGGPINLNYTLALRVKSKEPLYLRGNVLDTYNGFGWYKTENIFWQFSNNSKEKDGEKVEIIPENLKTSTFFTPLNTYKVISEKSSFIEKNKDKQH